MHTRAVRIAATFSAMLAWGSAVACEDHVIVVDPPPGWPPVEPGTYSVVASTDAHEFAEDAVLFGRYGAGEIHPFSVPGAFGWPRPPWVSVARIQAVHPLHGDEMKGVKMKSSFNDYGPIILARPLPKPACPVGPCAEADVSVMFTYGAGPSVVNAVEDGTVDVMVTSKAINDPKSRFLFKPDLTRAVKWSKYNPSIPIR